MSRGLVFFMRYKWQLFLLVIAAFIFVIYTLVFIPGFMSGDSINQYLQAKSGRYSDWHPPAMAIIWHYLMAITGKVSSLLVFQLTLLIGSLLAVSLIVYKNTSSKLKSLLPFVILALPSTFSIAGVLWKDVLLAFMLLASFVLAYAIRSTNKNTFRILLLILLSLCILVGVNVRHNALPAWIPLLAYIFFSKNILGLTIKKTRSKIVGIIAVLALGGLVIPMIINKVFNVAQDHVGTAIMIDDIAELSSPDEIKNSKVKDSTETYLLDLQKHCDEVNVQTDSLFLCAEVSNFVSLTHNDLSATESLWLQSIKQHPVQYMHYRLAQFYKFLTPESVYAWQEGTDPNPHGAPLASGKLQKQGREYAMFSMRDFGFLFRPYFWLILGLLCFAWCIKKRNNPSSALPAALASSGLIYIFSYVPTVIVYDYRMVYWSAISITLSLFFIITERTKQDKDVEELIKNMTAKSKDFEYTGVQVLEAMEEAKNYNKYLVRLVLKNARATRARGDIVDYGAGMGTYAKMISSQAGIKPVCLEPDQKLRSITAKHGFKSIASLKELKKKPRLVYSLNVFEHIKDDHTVTKQIYKEMGNGGRLLIYVPAFQMLYSSMDKKVEHFRRYRKKQLRDMVEGAGFTVNNVYYADPVGFFAALTYKIFDNGSGHVSPAGVKVFDTVAFPISLALQPLTKYFFGKNVVIEAVKEKS